MGDKSPSAGASGSEGRQRDMGLRTPQNLTVNIPQQNQEGFQERFDSKQKELFGRTLANEEFAMLVGAPDGATVNVGMTPQGVLAVVTTHEHIREQQRAFSKSASGDLIINNMNFKATNDAPPGFGTKVFTDQVNAARALGVKYIFTQAAGDSRAYLNGYYTWPRMGYDGRLGQAIDVDSIPPRIRKGMSDTTVQELFKTKEGRDWWKQNGSDITLRFDLNPNSVSSKVLDAYNEERRNRKT